jgi:hypothetical protein
MVIKNPFAHALRKLFDTLDINRTLFIANHDRFSPLLKYNQHSGFSRIQYSLTPDTSVLPLLPIHIQEQLEVLVIDAVRQGMVGAEDKPRAAFFHAPHEGAGLLFNERPVTALENAGIEPADKDQVIGILFGVPEDVIARLSESVSRLMNMVSSPSDARRNSQINSALKQDQLSAFCLLNSAVIASLPVCIIMALRYVCDLFRNSCDYDGP